MYVVTVLFQIKPGKTDAFLPLMTDNARTSREVEKGCQVFDICRDGDEIFLYEIYDDRAAFDAHLASDHFRSFDAAVSNMVTDKHVRLFDEVFR